MTSEKIIVEHQDMPTIRGFACHGNCCQAFFDGQGQRNRRTGATKLGTTAGPPLEVVEKPSSPPGKDGGMLHSVSRRKRCTEACSRRGLRFAAHGNFDGVLTRSFWATEFGEQSS